MLFDCSTDQLIKCSYYCYLILLFHLVLYRYPRVTAINANGFHSPFGFAPNLYAVPQLQLPSPPSLPALTVVGGSTMQVSFGASVAAGGADVNLYKVKQYAYPLITHAYLEYLSSAHPPITPNHITSSLITPFNHA